MSKSYRPRISVEIPEDLKKQMDELFRWGNLKPVIVAIVQDLVDILGKLSPADRELTVAAIIAGSLKPKDFVESLNKLEK